MRRILCRVILHRHLLEYTSHHPFSEGKILAPCSRYSQLENTHILEPNFQYSQSTTNIESEGYKKKEESWKSRQNTVLPVATPIAPVAPPQKPLLTRCREAQSRFNTLTNRQNRLFRYSICQGANFFFLAKCWAYYQSDSQQHATTSRSSHRFRSAHKSPISKSNYEPRLIDPRTVDAASCSVRGYYGTRDQPLRFLLTM